MSTPTPEKPYQSTEERIVAEALLPDSLDTSGFANWDGYLEISRCVQIDAYGTVERVEEGDNEEHWCGVPFWSVFAHQAEGGVFCVADFDTEVGANAFAAGLHVLRDYIVNADETTKSLLEAPLRTTAQAPIGRYSFIDNMGGGCYQCHIVDRQAMADPSWVERLALAELAGSSDMATIKREATILVHHLNHPLPFEGSGYRATPSNWGPGAAEIVSCDGAPITIVTKLEDAQKLVTILNAPTDSSLQKKPESQVVRFKDDRYAMYVPMDPWGAVGYCVIKTDQGIPLPKDVVILATLKSTGKKERDIFDLERLVDHLNRPRDGLYLGRESGSGDVGPGDLGACNEIIDPDGRVLACLTSREATQKLVAILNADVKATDLYTLERSFGDNGERLASVSTPEGKLLLDDINLNDALALVAHLNGTPYIPE